MDLRILVEFPDEVEHAAFRGVGRESVDEGEHAEFLAGGQYFIFYRCPAPAVSLRYR